MCNMYSKCNFEIWVSMVKFHFFVPMKRSEIVIRKSGSKCTMQCFGGWARPDPLGEFTALPKPTAGF